MPIAIYALALAAFAIGTAEFIIAGILPPLAADLAVSIPTAGLLVSVYALGVAIGGPLLTLFTARFSQRNVLIVMMIIFAVAQVLCALAPDYGLLMVARLLSAAGHGVFFGAGNVLVAKLVPPARRGAAFSLFIGGITVANLLGVPGGTAIGVAFGWRVTFFAVAAFAAIATLVLMLRLPPTKADDAPHAPLREQFRALAHHQVYLSYLTITLCMTGIIAFSTYQVPLMLNVTRLTPEVLPLYLLLTGIGSVLGIYLGGQGTDWKPMPTLITVLVLQAVFYFAMIFSMHDKVWWAVNLFITGILGFAFSTPLQARIMHAARAAPNLAASLVSTAFNIGIAAGAFIGALLLNAGVTYADLPAVGIVTSLLAAAVAGLSWWLEKRETAAA